MHRFRELARDREAEPAPRRPAGAVPAVETLEDLDRLLRADPGPSSSTTRKTARRPGRADADACRPALAKCVLDERAPDLEDPRLVAEAGRHAVDLGLEAVVAPLGDEPRTPRRGARDVREIDGVTIDTEAPASSRERSSSSPASLVKPVDLLPHAAQELALRRVVQVLVQ